MYFELATARDRAMTQNFIGQPVVCQSPRNLAGHLRQGQGVLGNTVKNG